MMNLDHFFARKTRLHTLALQNSPPCAKELYDWLLRQAPAGQPAEIYLENFQAEQAGRLYGKGYQLRWIKDCLKKLIELDLVQVVYKFSSKVFKLITVHPQQENAEPVQSHAENLQENAGSQPSNADSLALLYREEKETTDRPTLHPVFSDPQGRNTLDLIPTPSKPELEPESDPKVTHKIEAAGFRLNSTLIKLVRSTTAQIVLNAVEAAQQYQQRLQAQNKSLKREPEAVLVKAIQDGWMPLRGEVRNGSATVHPEFNEWFELAREVGLAIASSVKSDTTGHPPGVLCVLTNSDGWQPFDQVRRILPLAEVKDIAKKRREEQAKSLLRRDVDR